MANFNLILENLLKTDSRFVDPDGQLIKSAVIDRAWKIDHALMRLLLSNTTIKNNFFQHIDDHSIFNIPKFVEYIQDKNFLNDSYTKFGVKIGLTIDGKFLNQRGEVALHFPYKDCVLEGGMSNEDKKRDEILFNEILAHDEIDRLLDSKVLCNAKKHTANGAQKYPKFTRDETGTIRDNLIIKGNNLIALHTIKHQFAGKVKCIYIDPPYNTGNDGFKYNDRFNHSTWLTFMKNRLEIARQLLRDDGAIFVQCDDNEQAYLKVLMDEIFGRENFVTTLTWRKKVGGGQDSINFIKEHEFIICFQKQDWKIIEEETQHDIKDFNKIINNKKAKILKLEKWGNHSYRTDRPTLYYAIKDPNGKDFFPLAPDGKDGCWRKKPENLDEFHIYWQKSKDRLVPYEVIYYDEIKDLAKIEKSRSIFFEYGNTTDSSKEIIALFNNKLFATPKPEKLIKKILEIATQENDIVLDFHLGSGTTAAVAHKMGRQYIGIEQMDYIEDIAVERLKKVIAGEQGGVSKCLEWQGGGEFIYLELKKYNMAFIDQIQMATNAGELMAIWHNMKERSFLNWNIDFRKADLAFDEWQKLPIHEQKQALCDLLDKNQLYVQYSEINDSEFACTNDEKALSHDFYGK